MDRTKAELRGAREEGRQKDCGIRISECGFNEGGGEAAGWVVFPTPAGMMPFGEVHYRELQSRPASSQSPLDDVRWRETRCG